MITAGDMVKEKGAQIISVTVGTTVVEALKTMIAHGVGAILVTENDDYVGIWTERDLMRNTVDPDFDPAVSCVDRLMTKGVQFVSVDESVISLMDKLLGLRIRHLLVKRGEETVGLLSIGDVLKAAIREKSRELQDLNRVVSLQYYEEWRRKD